MLRAHASQGLDHETRLRRIRILKLGRTLRKTHKSPSLLYSKLGIYKENGKENGNYCIVYWGYNFRGLGASEFELTMVVAEKGRYFRVLRKKNYVYMYICIYLYLYIYIFRSRQGEPHFGHNSNKRVGHPQ